MGRNPIYEALIRYTLVQEKPGIRNFKGDGGEFQLLRTTRGEARKGHRNDSAKYTYNIKTMGNKHTHTHTTFIHRIFKFYMPPLRGARGEFAYSFILDSGFLHDQKPFAMHYETQAHRISKEKDGAR